MALGPLLQQRSRPYALVEYAGAVGLVLGLVTYSLEDASQLQFSGLGVVLVSGATLVEAAQGNLQERLVSAEQHAVPLGTALVATNTLSGAMLLAALAAAGQLAEPLAFLATNSRAALLVAAEATCGFVSASFYMFAIRHFGIVAVVSASLLRKCATLAVSFLLFPKPFGWRYVVAAVLVFGGVWLKMVGPSVWPPKRSRQESV